MCSVRAVGENQCVWVIAERAWPLGGCVNERTVQACWFQFLVSLVEQDF